MTEPASTYGYTAWGGSDTGRQRETNEDAFLCLPEEGIFAVIDGVGGYAGGEVAAEEAREVIRRRLQHRSGAPEVRLREAVTNANSKILLRSRKEPELTGMACVLTAVVVEDGTAVAAHVGDTRLYRLRGGRIEKITRDHSLVGVREDNAELTEYEAMHHPRRNEILRDVGSELHDPYDEAFIDIVTAPFEPDDALLLCTDGLTDLVPSRDLQRLMYTHAGDPEAAGKVLIEAANRAGGKDNVTVVVVMGDRFSADAPITEGHVVEDPDKTPLYGLPHVSPAVSEGTSRPAAVSAAPTSGMRQGHWGYFLYGMLTGILLLAGVYLGGRLLGAAWLVGIAGLPDRDPTPERPNPLQVPALHERLSGLAPGDTVYLAPGVYRETVRVHQVLRAVSDSSGALRILPLAGAPGDTLVATWGEGVARLDLRWVVRSGDSSAVVLRAYPAPPDTSTALLPSVSPHED